MKRWLKTLRWEVVLQARAGFYTAAAVMLAIIGLAALRWGGGDLGGLLPVVLFGNLQVTAFYFLAGMLMLEKEEGSLEARSITPLRPVEYLGGKVITLGALALVENMVLTGLFTRGNFQPAALTAGLLLGAGLLTLAGFLAAIRHSSVNSFLMPSILYLLALTLPIASPLGLVDSPLLYLHPLQPALTLISGGFHPLSVAEWLYGLGAGLAWSGVFLGLCLRRFHQFAVEPVGGGGE